jgi:hypothetical protein
MSGEPSSELEKRIAVVRQNIAGLVEQAAAFSGAGDEARAADRIAEQEQELARLIADCAPRRSIGEMSFASAAPRRRAAGARRHVSPITGTERSLRSRSGRGWSRGIGGGRARSVDHEIGEAERYQSQRQHDNDESQTHCPHPSAMSLASGVCAARGRVETSTAPATAAVSAAKARRSTDLQK